MGVRSSGSRPRRSSPGGSRSEETDIHIPLITIVVDDYDPAIDFFVDKMEFELAEDSPAVTTDGRAKRWVVVRPRGAETGIVLARADDGRQSVAVGNQTGGRVGFFLHVDDFESQYQRMKDRGVVFSSEPRRESYGLVAVFSDLAGNGWDLIGPA